jgi:sugar phosphate isomerase/epimerase
MSEMHLGINNCFAIGRFPEPEQWLRIVTGELGLSHVQFCYDLLDPVIIEEDVFRRKCKCIRRLAYEKGVVIDTGSTGEVPHKFNALLDPDPGLRRCYLRWYEKMVRAGRFLGVEGSGVYMGTLSRKDQAEPERRKALTEILLEEIAYLTFVAREEGQKYFLWEPMSIPREIPCTIDETKEILDRVNAKSHVPVRLCLDVGHGYIGSPDPRDRDPYAWLRELGYLSPVIHMQQTDGKGSRHWPFTAEYNRMGVIVPEKVFETVEKSGAPKTVIVFEFFFSAHAIPEEGVMENLKRSVEYWQEAYRRVYG